MNFTAKVMKTYRVTIPIIARDISGVRPGDIVQVTMEIVKKQDDAGIPQTIPINLVEQPEEAHTEAPVKNGLQENPTISWEPIPISN
jgi:bifunctional DNA-binding transcriptional regulator/antitoxin component of YhaV-PrlF toxin-antitoxin module